MSERPSPAVVSLAIERLRRQLGIEHTRGHPIDCCCQGCIDELRMLVAYLEGLHTPAAGDGRPGDRQRI